MAFTTPAQEALVTGGADILRRAGLANLDRDVDNFRRANSIATGGFSTSKKSAWTRFDDPTYVSFRLQFNFYQSPLFANALSAGVLGNISNTSVQDNAFSLLSKVAPNRSQYLAQFAKTLYDIQNNSHYIFTGVTGIDTAWEKSIGAMNGDPFIGGDDATISISMLESVDFKSTALMTLYRLAMYDMKHRRTIVPINLRYFDVDIYIQEIRNFRKTLNAISAVQAVAGGSANLTAGEFVNNNISTVIYRFKECEWLPEASKTLYESLTSTPTEQAKQTVSFTYNDFEIETEILALEGSLVDVTRSSLGTNLLSTGGDGPSSLIQKLKDEAPDLILRQAGRLLKNSTLTLGRVPVSNPEADAELRRSIAQTFTAANIAQGSLDSGQTVGFITPQLNTSINPTRAFDTPTLSIPNLPGNLSAFDDLTGSTSPLGEDNIFSGFNSPSVEIGEENVFAGENPFEPAPLTPSNVLGDALPPGPLTPSNVFR
jgi:hypothetical protein